MPVWFFFASCTVLDKSNKALRMRAEPSFRFVSETRARIWGCPFYISYACDVCAIAFFAIRFGTVAHTARVWRQQQQKHSSRQFCKVFSTSAHKEETRVYLRQQRTNILYIYTHQRTDTHNA